MSEHFMEDEQYQDFALWLENSFRQLKVDPSKRRIVNLAKLNGMDRRFELFAEQVRAEFNPQHHARVADIAGGTGRLQLALNERGFENVTTYDIAITREPGIQYQNRYFGVEDADNYDLLLGLHPDEATDLIIISAWESKIPFAICPCCIMPNLEEYHGPQNSEAWITHLVNLTKRLDYQATLKKLDVPRGDVIIIGQPK